MHDDCLTYYQRSDYTNLKAEWFLQIFWFLLTKRLNMRLFSDCGRIRDRRHVPAKKHGNPSG